MHESVCPEYGSGPPLVILHGLFGSGENYRSFAWDLGDEYRVILPDLRNHGQSGHSFGMSYPVLANDVIETLDDMGVDRFHIIGHSMGGKTAMEIALTFPRRVDRLVVVDIAPKKYGEQENSAAKALLELPVSAFSTRAEMDAALSSYVKDRRTRLFLLKNAERDSSGRFRFRAGLEEIREGCADIWGSIEGGRSFTGKTLFLKGGDSPYISDNDISLIAEFFPNARLVTISGAGHWVQADRPEEFVSSVRRFLEEQS